MRLRASILALPVALLAAAGCGGGGGSGGGGAVPNGASVVPDSAVAFISVDTDLSSDQVQKAIALFRKFPGSEQLLAQGRAELAKDGLDWSRDVKPALGPELDVVFLDFRNGGGDVVALMQPKDEAKIDKVVSSGSNPLVHEKVGDWEVFSDKQAKIDQFKQAQATGGKLADDKRFKDAMGALPTDTVARAYLPWAPVQAEIEGALQGQNVPPSVVQDTVGKLDSLAAAATALDNGARVDLDVNGDVKLGSGYSPKLTSTLPSGALLYLSFAHLDTVVRSALDAVTKSNPSFKTQLSQVEAALGFSLEGDVLPLLAGEGALAIYPGSPLPTIDFVLAVKDEAKAKRLLERVGAFAQLGGLKAAPTTIDGVSASELKIPGQSFSIFYAVFDGKLVVTDTRQGIAGLKGGGAKLADDSLYKQASKAADQPGNVNALLYMNLRDGLPAAFRFAKSTGSTVPPAARANTRPLQSALLFATKSGKRVRVTGFAGIR